MTAIRRSRPVHLGGDRCQTGVRRLIPNRNNGVIGPVYGRLVPPILTVIGTGYLGATHAVCMAELGFTVIGLDVDPVKIDQLNAGEVPFYEPGLEPLLRKNLEAGRPGVLTRRIRG